MSPIQPRAGGEVVVTTLRLPRALRDEMKIQAIRAGRSLNTHVAMILNASAGESEDNARPAKTA